MGKLCLTLLGPPEVRHADQVVLFSTRKELALLIYLAVEGRLHLRKTLSEQFWPEGTPGMAGQPCALPCSTSGICSGGSDEDPGVDHVPHLLIQRDTLGLDLTSDFELDLHLLHEAWTVARASTSTTLTMPEDAHRTLLAQLQRATSLPRGAFLEGFSLRDAPAFDDWMRLHFAAGDRAAALHAYDTCRARLSTGMQTEPSPETVALASRMRAVAPPRRREAPTPALALSPAALLDGPLLGRTAELSTLIQVYHRAQGGQTQVVLLEGEVGIGKTRLATEFLAWAEVEGADVLQGQAFEAGGQLPYRPLIEALRPRIERENAPDDLLSDTWLAELARLLPELGDRYPDLPAPTGDKAVARNRLFEAVARLLQALAKRAPLVVFLDDVQWADAASLDVVHHLARRFAESQTPALLLLALRVGERGMRPALAEWRAAMERAVPLTHLPLGPLTSQDILRLLSVFGGKGDQDGRRTAEVDRFGQWLFAETEGQPFYVMETLKVLLEQGVLASRPSGDGGWTFDFPAALEHETVVRGFFPPSVREVICARLDRLTPSASALLVAGAVLSQGITFEHLCQVADLAEQDGLSVLDEVLHSGLLYEVEREGEGRRRVTSGHYVFAHAMIRAVVYAEAGEARCTIFHRRAVQALQEAAAPSAELAYQTQAAGLAEPAFHWNLAAGDEAMRVVAVRDAIAFYEQARHLMAERLLGTGTMLPAPEIEHLYTHLGRAYELDNEWEKARTIYTLMLVYAQDAGQLVMESTALNRLAILAAQQPVDLATAQTLLEAALRAAEASGDPVTLAETEWNLAQIAIHAWKSKRALLHAGHALERALLTGLKELTARCLYTLGLSYAFGGHWKEVVASASEARTLYAAIEDQTIDATGLSAQLTYVGFPPSWQLTNRSMEVLCLGLLALGHVNLGEPQAGVHVARVALAMSSEINNVWVQAYSVLNLNHALLEVGEYEEALRVTQKGVELARTLPNPTLLFFMLTV